MIKLLVALLVLVPSFSVIADSQPQGLITVKSKNSVSKTIEKFENSVKAKGFKVFTRLDHAAAAKEYGLQMPPATIIIFGNPKMGTPVFIKTPTVAIDLPLKAMVWEDSEGEVFFSMNSAAYLFGTIYPRHGIKRDDKKIARATFLFENFVKAATN